MVGEYLHISLLICVLIIVCSYKSDGYNLVKIWDHAAGVAVIEEAGGVVTDVYGKKLDFSKGRTLSENKGVIVSNGQFHDEVLVAVRDVLGL